MKKNVKNRLFEQQYNNVMKRLGTAVRRILESEVCDIDEDDVYEIEDISELALEDFYNPSMNASFANYKDNCIFCRDNKIGFGVKIIDNDNNARVVAIFRNSFGKALEDFDVILQASIYNMSDHFYEFKISDVVNKFYKAFKNATTDEMADEFDARADDFYYKCFANAESVDAVVKGIKRMENNF